MNTISKIREKLLGSIEQLERLDSDSFSPAAYDELADISRQIELSMMRLRKILIQNYDDFQLLEVSLPSRPMENPPELEIQIFPQEAHITLDAMLPFRIKGSAYYLHQKLDTALLRFRKETPYPYPLFQQRCAVVFLHHYRTGEGAIRELRDYDNLERRCILNVLARHFLRDDSPACCISMDIVAPGESNYTEIRIMTIPHFREFVLSESIEYVPEGTLSKSIPAIYQKT